MLRRANEPSLPSNRFANLVSTADGRVWAASEDGGLLAIGAGPDAGQLAWSGNGRAERLQLT